MDIEKGEEAESRPVYVWSPQELISDRYQKQSH